VGGPAVGPGDATGRRGGGGEADGLVAADEGGGADHHVDHAVRLGHGGAAGGGGQLGDEAVPLVHEVVGRQAGPGGGGDAAVEGGHLGGEAVHLGGHRRHLGGRRLAERGEAVVGGVEGGGEGAAPLDHLPLGRLVVRAVREVLPAVPELREH